MSQSKRHSMVEALVNVAVGFGLSMATNAVALPLIGCEISLKSNLLIGAIFTVISILRSYALRRTFNWISHGKAQKA